MSGNVRGGLRAATTNKERYGDDFYSRIGALGGAKGHTGGFAANHDLARWAGAIGGRKSRIPTFDEEVQCSCGKRMNTKRGVKNHRRKGHTVEMGSLLGHVTDTFNLEYEI